MTGYNTIMNVQIINGESIFSIPEHDWNDLVNRGMTNTPFQLHAYQKAWWMNLKPQNSSLFSIVVRDEDENLIAIGCFYLTEDGVLKFNGCVEETDYLDLIVEAQHAFDAWATIFNILKSDNFPQWRLMELCNIPEISPSRTILNNISDVHGLSLIESVNEVCPVIQLPTSYEIYLETLNSKNRRELKRKLRKANGAEVKFSVIGPKDDLEQAVDDFLELLQQSTFEKRDWLNEGRRQLFHQVAKNAHQSGFLMLSFAEVNGKRAAGLFNFDYADRVWVYNSGLDPKAFSNLSLGVVITGQAISWAIENNRQEFDFLRGNETYKYRFGAEDTKVFKIDISPVSQ